ncbi:hypothetical protein YC2023_082376 [Brassica napus]
MNTSQRRDAAQIQCEQNNQQQRADNRWDHGSKRKCTSDTLYTFATRGEQDHNRRCHTCLTGASREWVPKREERCSDSIGNIVRAIKANIAAALVKMPMTDFRN